MSTEGENAGAVDTQAIEAAAAAVVQTDTEAPATTEAATTEGDAAATAAQEKAKADDEAYAQIIARSREREEREKGRLAYEEELDKRATAKASAQEKAIEERLRREFAERVQKDTLGVLREVGVDGEQITKRMVDETSPAAAIMKKFAELEAQNKRLLDGIEAEKTDRQKQREEEEQAKFVQAQRTAESELLKMATPENTPFARALYDDDAELLRKAHDVARIYREETGAKTCPLPIALQYLEAEARRAAKAEAEKVTARAARLASLLQQPAGGTVQAHRAERAQPPRTPSQTSSSERHATPKAEEDLSEQEMDERMRAAARAKMGPKKPNRLA